MNIGNEPLFGKYSKLNNDEKRKAHCLKHDFVYENMETDNDLNVTGYQLTRVNRFKETGIYRIRHWENEIDREHGNGPITIRSWRK